jgi:hypothetical protein
MKRFLDADAAAAMLRWENSGFSVDASVRITLINRDVPSYYQKSRASAEIVSPAALRAGTALREVR